MAILINQSNNNNSTSGENLLASSSLENSINEARNLSIELDQKIADLKSKTEEFKQESDVTLTAVFVKMDAKETAFAKSINSSATNAVSKIKVAIEELKEGSETIKNVSNPYRFIYHRTSRYFLSSIAYDQASQGSLDEQPGCFKNFF